MFTRRFRDHKTPGGLSRAVESEGWAVGALVGDLATDCDARRLGQARVRCGRSRPAPSVTC